MACIGIELCRGAGTITAELLRASAKCSTSARVAVPRCPKPWGSKSH